MMSSRAVDVGAIIEIEAAGGIHLMRIVELKDGRVILARPSLKSRGRWWLPYEYVRKHGTLKERANAQKSS